MAIHQILMWRFVVEILMIFVYPLRPDKRVTHGVSRHVRKRICKRRARVLPLVTSLLRWFLMLLLPRRPPMAPEFTYAQGGTFLVLRRPFMVIKIFLIVLHDLHRFRQNFACGIATL